MHNFLNLFILSTLFFVFLFPQQSPAPKPEISPEVMMKLLKVKRIFVEEFGQDPASKIVHAAMINSLASSGTFIITEKRETADAIFKGTLFTKSTKEIHALSDSTTVTGSSGYIQGSSSSSVSGTIPGRVEGSGSSNVQGASSSTGISVDDTQVRSETIEFAALAVRLVSVDGDVLWNTTQESNGAKYKSVFFDVTEKVTLKIQRLIERISRQIP